MNFRNVCMAALLVVSGALGASCQSQPIPFCPVAIGSPLGFPSPGSPLAFTDVQFALPNSWAKYTLKSGSGACSLLAGEEIGFQRYEIPGKPTELTLAVRPFRTSYMKGNEPHFISAEWADYDPENFYDGDDLPDPAPVFRVDPMDPDGKNLNSIGAFGASETDPNACVATGLTPIDVTFQEEVFDLLPGGAASERAIIAADVATFPELHVRYEFDQLTVLSTPELPGAVFTAQLKYTEDACTATYDVVGIWPITLCHTDLDCSPLPVESPAAGDLGIAAREFQGSGLSPTFETEEHKLKCNNSAAVHAYTASYGQPPLTENPAHRRQIVDYTYHAAYGVDDWGICEMTRPVSDFSAAAQ